MLIYRCRVCGVSFLLPRQAEHASWTLPALAIACPEALYAEHGCTRAAENGLCGGLADLVGESRPGVKYVDLADYVPARPGVPY